MLEEKSADDLLSKTKYFIDYFNRNCVRVTQLHLLLINLE